MSFDVALSDEGVATVTLSNPARRNALDLDLLKGLAVLWPRMAEDRSIRAIVLTGAGEAFRSGADLSAGLASRQGIDDLIEKALLKTAFFPKPLVAAINGHCVADGSELALAADIRIAREDAKLGFPEVGFGIMPSGGATMKLTDQIGHAHAMDLLLTGRLIDGREAERMGLVNAAVSGSEVLHLAYERARMIARNSPVALEATKRAALSKRSREYALREQDERLLAARVRASGHPQIGIAAFLAKASPTFEDD